MQNDFPFIATNNFAPKPVEIVEVKPEPKIDIVRFIVQAIGEATLFAGKHAVALAITGLSYVKA